MTMTRFLLMYLVLSFTFALHGQDQEEVPSGEIEDQQVIIEKDKPLTLPKANRIYQPTNIQSIEMDTVKLNYHITQPTYEFEPYFAQFKFKTLESVQASGLGYNNFIKAGYGNYGSPLVQAYFGVDYENNHAGVWLNHESFQTGPVRDDESAYSLSEILVDGFVTGGKVALTPEIHYQREGYYFYGYDADALEVIDPPTHPFVTDRIVTNHFSFSANLSLQDQEDFQLSVKPFYQTTGMKVKGGELFNEENVIGLGGKYALPLGEGLDAGVETDFNHYNYTSGIGQVRNVFRLKPYLTYQNDILSLYAGLTYFSAGDSLTSGAGSYFYPDLKARFQLNQNLSIFARLSGTLNPTSLNELRLTNRYLDDSLALLNQNEKVDFQGGLEINPTEKLLLRGFVRYKQTTQKAMFFHSVSDSSRFSVLYDLGNFNEFGFGLQGRYFVSTNTAISANLMLTGFDTDTVSDAWYLPAVEFDLTASQVIREVLKLRASLIILDGMKAPDPVTFAARDLNAIVDLNIGAQYDFMPNAGAFLELENLLSGNFERYLNYPSRGLMLKLGFIYRF